MQPASETTKTPWHLRFAPGAILRKKAIIAIIAVVALLTQAPVEKAEAFTLLDLIQAIRQLQELASTNSVSTNSLPTFSSLQEGDTIVAMKKKGAKETIAEWLRNIFGGAAGNQLTKQGQTLVAQPAVANTAGTVRALGGGCPQRRRKRGLHMVQHERGARWSRKSRFRRLSRGNEPRLRILRLPCF